MDSQKCRPLLQTTTLSLYRGWTGRSDHSGEYPKDRLQEVEKTLNSGFRELRIACIKELTLIVWINQKFVALFNTSPHRFTLSRIHGPV